MPREPQQELMTLAVVDGVEHILDLSTGQQMRIMPTALRTMRRIAERSVNKERIQAVLHAAGIPSSRDEDGDIVAKLYGEEVCILISPDRTFVRFLKMLEVKPFVPEDALNAALRHLSNGYDVARFRCFRDGFVCADYSMTYEFGISPQQMIEMLKGFTWTVQQAFRSEEFAGLLEG